MAKLPIDAVGWFDSYRRYSDRFPVGGDEKAHRSVLFDFVSDLEAAIEKQEQQPIKLQAFRGDGSPKPQDGRKWLARRRKFKRQWVEACNDLSIFDAECDYVELPEILPPPEPEPTLTEVPGWEVAILSIALGKWYWRAVCGGAAASGDVRDSEPEAIRDWNEFAKKLKGGE